MITEKKGGFRMKIKFNVKGSERKNLVNAVEDLLEVKPIYQGAPTFAYKIKDFTVDKNGTLFLDDSTDSANVLDGLVSRGFIAEETENATQGNIGLVIELLLQGFTDTALLNLERLVESKNLLIKKALGVNNLPIIKTEDRVSFPWFSSETTADEVKAYTQFICALCEMAKSQKRITATPRPVDNEKYAFRCFILRLGFVGTEYKTERKILLSKLTGSSAFKAPKSEVNDNE